MSICLSYNIHISLCSFAFKAKYTNATKNKICLFVVSTSNKKFEFIKKQFETYDPSYFGMIVRIYDANGTNETNTSGSITRLFFGGIKTQLWQSISKAEVEHYEYVWFMDDDLLFSKHVLPFDQFLHIVKTSNSVISTPKNIRNTNTGKKHRSVITKEMLGNEFAEEVDLLNKTHSCLKPKLGYFFTITS